MTGPSPAVAATRVAVRAALADVTEGGLVLVACSGGADSLALAAATAFEAPRRGVRAGAVVVDHGLQAGSEQVAARTAAECARLGLDPVSVVRADIEAHAADRHAGGGPEAIARAARYAALAEAADEPGAAAVLLGHTRDDQAEQVLLGLVRGSGARSLAGMPRRRGVFVRPLLDLPAATTRQACADLGLQPWSDPHNSDQRFARVRARAMVEVLEAKLGPGVGAALARSARLLRADADALDRLAARAAADLGEPPWPVGDLAGLDPAVRGRVWRVLARAAGVPLGALSLRHVEEAEKLVCDYRGQGGISWPGGHVVTRQRGFIGIESPLPQIERPPVD